MEIINNLVVLKLAMNIQLYLITLIKVKIKINNVDPIMIKKEDSLRIVKMLVVH
jgi:hypothetical protein